MKKYEVTLHYYTSVIVEVKAKDEEDAIEKAYVEVGKPKYGQLILSNLQEDSRPDVEEVED